MFNIREIDYDQQEYARLAEKQAESEEIFDGVISGVTGWGLYVELPNTVEGLVSVSGMCDDDYSFDEEKRAMTGRLSRRSYTLGDPVRVRVQGGDLRTRTIDFELI